MPAASLERSPGCCVRLEGQDHIQELGAVARLLDIGELAAAAIGDARFRDLVVADGVGLQDVLGPDDAAETLPAWRSADSEEMKKNFQKKLAENLGDAALKDITLRNITWPSTIRRLLS